jgi:hypothetical protein
MKDLFLTMGIENFFVLDGIGSLLGVTAGNNRGPVSENLLELKKYCAADGVHFTKLGYANLSKVIVSAITGIESGTLTKAKAGAGDVSGKSRGSVFFWRGFTSPNGHTGTRALPPADPFPHQQQHAMPPSIGSQRIRHQPTSSGAEAGAAQLEATPAPTEAAGGRHTGKNTRSVP